MGAVKWVGSKAAQLDFLLRHFPERCETFVDLMCGTGVVGLEMARRGRVRAIYAGGVFHEVLATTSVSCTPAGRGGSREVLIEVCP